MTKLAAYLLASIGILSVVTRSLAFSPLAIPRVKGRAVKQEAFWNQKENPGINVPLALKLSEDNAEISSLKQSDQGILGGLGTIAALITFYSEYTLKTTGCGLPAGPFGLLGLAEGLSYLGVTGIAAYSLVKKFRTVSLYKSTCDSSLLKQQPNYS